MGNEFNSRFFYMRWSSSQLFCNSLNYPNFISRTIQSFFCISFLWLISWQLEGGNYFGSTFFYFLAFPICFTWFYFIPSSVPYSSGVWMNMQVHFGIKMEEFDCGGSTEQKQRDFWFSATHAVTLFQPESRCSSHLLTCISGTGKQVLFLADRTSNLKTGYSQNAEKTPSGFLFLLFFGLLKNWRTWFRNLTRQERGTHTKKYQWQCS